MGWVKSIQEFPMTRTILITGCSSGFGAAAAQLFSDRGWNVVATMRRPDADSALTRRENVLVTRLDVIDRNSIASAIEAGIARFGRIDAIVNNAGYGLHGIFEALPRQKIQEQFDVNVFGVMDVIRAILPHFRANRSGTIINISSGAGAFGFPTASLYNASKFALEGFSEALSYELAGLGVKVRIVEPGGAPGTGFLARSGAEGEGADVPADYDEFLASLGQVFEGFIGRSDSDAVEKVVDAIFAAATDDGDRLRYVATDDIKPLIAARRETSEEQYMAHMRALFSGKA
jgi:NAD(P)-dependent dehydrogenase (short-subunit alcohol dehydrogenase family)